jgi:hypothetical protein
VVGLRQRKKVYQGLVERPQPTANWKEAMVMGQYPRMILASVVLMIGVTLSSSQEVLRAQEVDKPVIPPQPRTINLTQEQRFVIRENVKDLTLSKASKDAPETIGDPVPPDIVLHALPSEVGVKVPQVRSHMFFIKGR